MKSNQRFLLVMAGAVLLLGVLPLLEKQAVQQVSSLFTVTVVINLFTILVLWIPGWRARPATLTYHWRDVVLIGVIASCIVVLLNLKALETTSATHRSVFQAMYPAAAAVFSYWLLRERLLPVTYGIIAVMVVGIIIMSSQGIRLAFATGDLLLFATLPLMGFTDTWVKRSVQSLAPAWVALCRFATGTIALLAAGLVSGNVLHWPEATAWPWLVASGICIGGGILLLYQGIDMRGASLAAALVGMAPVVTLLLEWGLLGESFTVVELLGMVLVIGGGLLLTRPRFQGQ